MAIGSAIGAIAGIGGSLLSARSQDRATDAAIAASQFRPFDIYGGGLGGVNFHDGHLGARLNPELERISRLFGRDAQRRSPGIGFIDATARDAARGMGGFARDAFAGIDQSLGMQTGATGMFGADLGALQGQLPGILSQFRQDSLGAGVVDPSSQFAIQQAQGLLGQDASGVIGDTLSRLRASARPAEERAVNSRVNQLFNRGILSGTAGARSLGELAQSQELADIQRQQLAEQAGLSRFNAQQSAGQSLLNLGQSGLLQGRQLNQAFAGTGANLGFQGLNTGLDISQGLFGARMGLAEAVQNRGLNRVQLAQGLFGFGQDARQADQVQRINALNSRLAINQDLRNLIALGGNLGGQQAAAGANQANAIMANSGSPIGGFLTGAGAGLLEQTLPNLFET